MGQSVRKREGSNLRSPFVAALPRQLAVHLALRFCGIAALVSLNSCAAGLVGSALGIQGLSEDSNSDTPVVSFVGKPAAMASSDLGPPRREGIFNGKVSERLHWQHPLAAACLCFNESQELEQVSWV